MGQKIFHDYLFQNRAVWNQRKWVLPGGEKKKKNIALRIQESQFLRISEIEME